MAGRSNKRRTKGAGSIIRIGKKYYLQIYENGKKIKKSLRTENKQEAEKKAKEILPDLHSKTRAEFVTKVAEIKRIAAKDNVKLDNAWNLFYESPFRRQTTSEGTLGNYKRNWEQFVVWTNDSYPNLISMSQISLNIASDYAQHLWTTGIGGCTYNYKIGSLKTITKILLHKAGLESNVWEKVERKQEFKVGKKGLLQDEEEKLFAAFQDPELILADKEQLEVLFYIGLTTGSRLVDGALFEYKYIDYEENLISFIPQKTKGFNKKVSLPIFPKLYAYLDKAQKEWGGEKYIIPQIAKRYLANPYDIRNDVLKVFKHAGFETTIENSTGQQRLKNPNQYGFHSLRHTFISECASSNVPVNVLSEMTGDKIQTLQKYYIKINKKAVQDVAKIMNAASIQHAEQVEQKALPENNVKMAVSILKKAKKLTAREKEILSLLEPST